MKTSEVVDKLFLFVKNFGWNPLLVAETLPQFSRYTYVVFYIDEIDFSNEFHVGRKSYMFETKKVKRLVNSYKVVERCGGLEKAKLRCYLGKHLSLVSYCRLKQAVEDVESCK